jgi:hypothetical protein
MSGRYPEIVYTEEGMREGMQIEDANIPIDAKVALLDAGRSPSPAPTANASTRVCRPLRWTVTGPGMRRFSPSHRP